MVGLLSLGQPVRMYTQLERADKSGSENAWFDGFISVFSKTVNDYLGFGADGQGGTIRTVGPITDLAASATTVSMGSLAGFNYLGGGPVVQFGATASDLAMIMHLEKFPAGGAGKFHASLGVAKSANAGLAWTPLGQIISLSYAYDAGETVYFQDTGGGPMVKRGNYYYAYFRDYIGPNYETDSYWSVARCLITDFNAAVIADTAPPFEKIQDDGTWGGSNTGAELTTLERGMHWCDIWEDTTHGVLMAIGDYLQSLSPYLVYPSLQFSYDGITWFGRTNLGVAAEECSYVSLVPTTITGDRQGSGIWNAIYVAGTRWTNATIQRRTFTIGNIGRAVRPLRF